MKPIKLLSIFISVFIMLLVSGAKAETGKIFCTGHPDYKPFMWQHDDTIVGAGPELLRMIFNELKKDFLIKYIGPWARAQEMMQRGNVDFFAGAYDNQERRQYMVYLLPYASDQTSVFVHRDRPFAFSSRDDLVGRKGVTVHGDSFGEEMDRFIEEKLGIARVYNSSSMFRKLADGTMAYILWGDYPCEINAAMQGFQDILLRLSPPLTVEGMHLTVSKKSPHLNLAPKMNQIIERLKKNGKIQVILKKYTDLYVSSQRVAGKDLGAMIIMVDENLSKYHNLIAAVSAKVWSHVDIRRVSGKENFKKALAAGNPVFMQEREKPPRYRWIPIRGNLGFVVDDEFNTDVLSLWRLTYEAWLNQGRN